MAKTNHFQFPAKLIQTQTKEIQINLEIVSRLCPKEENRLLSIGEQIENSSLQRPKLLNSHHQTLDTNLLPLQDSNPKELWLVVAT